MVPDHDQDACIIIPARYASTRFPGKPLVPLLGTPMILWVAKVCREVLGEGQVIIATESARIAQCVEDAGFRAVMTDPDALTGTDRVAEVAATLPYDIIVNVQGDEPMVRSEDIRSCIRLKRDHPTSVVNGYCWIHDEDEIRSVHTPKVVTSEDDRMLYMSRSPVPGYKDVANRPHRYKKQVCIYGFSRAELAAYQGFGRKGTTETHEDIEILRFLEIGHDVLMYECHPGSLAVDVPEDVHRVEQVLRRQAAR